MTKVRWFLYGLVVAFVMAFGYEAARADYQYNAIFCGVLAMIFTLIIPFCVPRRTKLMVTTMTFVGTAMLLTTLVVYRVNSKELAFLAPLAFGLIAHIGAVFYLKDFGQPVRSRNSS